jgi:enamine deaminase RidA (YjgF/YER057c/UK114 family)
MDITAKLAELGLELPKAAAPVAAYVPAVEHGGLLYVSGQLPFRDGQVVTGRLGDDMDVAGGQDAAQRVALMLIAQLAQALDGDLSRLERVIKLGVFVNSAPSFTDQAKVANGASDLFETLFGDAGRHARAAVGVAVLPLGAAVEADAIVAVRSA